MRDPKKLLVFAVLGLLVMSCVAYVFVVPGPKSLLMGYDHSRQRAFDEFKVGDTKTRLLSLLGEPLSTGAYFPREIAYRQSDFAAEDLAKCVEYLTFRNGGNWFYCFGVDANGKTVLKADGNS